MNSSERIFVGDMFKMSIAWKGQGLKPYYIEDGVIKPLLASACRNKWGAIYLLMPDEIEKINKISDLIKDLLNKQDEQRKLLKEFLAAKIHEIVTT